MTPPASRKEADEGPAEGISARASLETSGYVDTDHVYVASPSVGILLDTFHMGIEEKSQVAHDVLDKLGVVEGGLGDVLLIRALEDRKDLGARGLLEVLHDLLDPDSLGEANLGLDAYHQGWSARACACSF